MKVGVLALQGAFIEHVNMIEKCGHQAILVRKPVHLNQISRLIIPGGESTAIGRLMARYSLDEKIVDLYQKTNLPIFGTCAGMILLAKTIEEKRQGTFSLRMVDITVKRNASGRQIDSFETDLEIKGITPPPFRGIFIRAPYILNIGNNVQILSRFNEKIVFVRQDNIIVASFHPELGTDLRIHNYFINSFNQL